ncbi:MAG: hypothetical protein WKG06_26995 [Segetibacter sp.]
MYKKQLLLLCALFTSSFLFAQTQSSRNSKTFAAVDVQKDKKQIGDFTVMLRPGIKNTYFFNIFKKGETAPIKPNYSLTMVLEGYNSKEDAFNAAASLIQEYKVNGHFPPINPPHPSQEPKH